MPADDSIGKQRPEVTYETVILRDFSAGYAEGVIQHTLEPEDSIYLGIPEGEGDIKIIFHLTGRKLVCHREGRCWWGIEERAHRRVVK